MINKLQSKFVRDNHCRNVHAFFTQVENELGLLVDLHLMHTMRRSQDMRLFAGNLVLAYVMEIFVCLRRSYRHCKIVVIGVSGVVILQTGSSFNSVRGM